MSKQKKKRPFPSKEDILNFIRRADVPPGKREIARAFHISGDDRITLKELLNEIKRDGLMPRKHDKGGMQSSLPQVAVIQVTAINDEGEAVARPVEWEHKKIPPHIIITMQGRERAAPGVGARVLAKLSRVEPHLYSAHIIRVLPEQPTERLLGVFRLVKGQGIVEPISKKQKITFRVKAGDEADAKPGDLVAVQPEGRTPSRGNFDSAYAKVIERLGHIDAPRAASMIAIQHQDIPYDFSPASIAQAESAESPVPKGREDLRHIPLVTIDGEDARDFDDAVFAEPDTHVHGGWHLMVAIADVAHYVRPNDALDIEAYLRGNSVYFPDRVVPMLPEALSNGLCSLKPNEDRYCIAVHLWIDAQGNLTRHQFIRGIMRSHARLTYEQAQAIYNNKDDKKLSAIVEPLYGAYAALNKNRERRGTLDLDIPEYKVILDKDGKVSGVQRRQRLDSHKLIEEFMIAANVAAAMTIENAGVSAMFRTHEPPDPMKVTDLRDFLGQLGYHLSKGDGLKPIHFNKVLEASRAARDAHLVHTAILRSQTQAYYSPRNVGHFGLALEKYCHFTSPIRRYSDVIVHRALIAILSLPGHQTDGLDDEQTERLPEVAEHISMTERRAMLAEREANDRYLTMFMADKIGGEFEGHISGVNSFGLFITLSDTGANGFIPISSLQDDFYYYEKRYSCLVGRKSRRLLQLSQRVTIRLKEAITATGSMRFELVSAEYNERRITPSTKPGKDQYRKKPGGKKHQRSVKKRR